MYLPGEAVTHHLDAVQAEARSDLKVLVAFRFEKVSCILMRKKLAVLYIQLNAEF